MGSGNRTDVAYTLGGGGWGGAVRIVKRQVQSSKGRAGGEEMQTQEGHL